ncbi:hypothetical protein M1N80_02295 [Peptococcaceae bacterium]|nr:hypothetical protein [Peptococcaceae bacterium]
MKYLKMWNLTEEIIRALIKLKNEGYTIVLDDFIYHKDLIGLLKIADIVKIDFLQTKETERKKVLNDILKINPHVRFLAEKLETREEFDQAKKDGYVYFQGYFFAKTAVLSNRDVPASKTLHLNLLKKVTREVKEAPLREGNVLNDVLNLIISWGKHAGRRNGTLLGKIKAK